MRDFRPLWKHLTNTTGASAYHTIQFAIIQALYKTNGDPEKASQVALKTINQAFTPISKRKRLENGHHPLMNLKKALADAFHKTNGGDVLGGPPELFTKEDLSLYNNTLYHLSKFDLKEYFDRKYVYIFVRQDISPEYQLVQSSHVALDRSMDPVDPNQLYFSVIGVNNLQELESVKTELKNLEITHHQFIEPDIGDQVTAVATYPVHNRKRGSLLRYKRLKFS